MNKDDRLSLEITGVNSEGDGIARSPDGHVIFVRGALPGERVNAVIEHISRSYARARAVEIVEPQDVRRAPRCRHFGRCGGCTLQHASYGAQTAIKSRILADAMRRIAGIENDLKIECVPSHDEWGYRTKTSMPVRTIKDRTGRPRTICGYFEPGSHRVVRYGECPVLAPSLQRVVPMLIETVASSGLRGYDERNRSGDVRFLTARSGGARDESVIACIVAARELSKREAGALRDRFQKLAAQAPELVGASLNINTDPGNFIWGSEFRTIFGAREIPSRLGEFELSVDVSSFFQINRGQAETLFKHASELVASTGARKILELYSGVGSLTAFIAGGAESVDAVEEWRPAIRRLEMNMKKNGITNTISHASSVEAFLSEHRDEHKWDTVVLDPPRTGLPAEAASDLTALAPKGIIYVSCDPATLARDVARISSAGYELRSIKAFDMFPQTSHVESVVQLSRVKDL